MKTPARPFVLAVLFTALRAIHAADYEGADAILKQITAHDEAAAAAQPEKKGETPEKFSADLNAFRKSAATLAPDQAAKGWLDLADRFPNVLKASFAREVNRMSMMEEEMEERPEEPPQAPGFAEVLAALPPPAAWPALAKAVEARPADGAGAYHVILLRLIAHRLTRDNTALNKDIEDLLAFAKKAAAAGGTNDRLGARPENLKKMLADLGVPVTPTPAAANADDGAAVLAKLNMALTLPPNTGGMPQPQMIAVPDLVTLVGADKAADFLRRALAANVIITSVAGDETAKLASKLALEMVAELKLPQWSLAHPAESTELFEAMEKRFPHGGTGNAAQGYGGARMDYLFALLAANRMKEAAAVATGIGATSYYLPDEGAGTWESARMEAEVLPPDRIYALQRAGSADTMVDFLHDVLAQNPGLPYWANYFDIAVRAGQQDKMIALAEASLARGGMADLQRRRVTGYLRGAYLAVDRVDDGIALLRKEIAEAKTNPATIHSEDLYVHAGSYLEDNVGIGQLGLKLARLGVLLNRKDLVDEGVQTVMDALKPPPGSQGQYAADGAIPVATLLIELDRGPEAEAVLKNALLSLPQIPRNSSAAEIDRTETMKDAQATDYLVMLMDIYDRAHRPADVLALLDHAPGWSAKNLSGILTKGVTIDRNVDYAGYFAANAFAATGKTAEARKVLDALLDQVGNYDPAYELLIKIAPRDEALARLDALFARDKFEPRPLIWKAKVLLDAGKLEEAEAAARQAMAIDPSDGEQGPGRRMRVYSVLADIRAARGDNKEAEFYRGAVAAIRQSEDADRFYQAGLTTRAIKMYNDSLTHFADAYCIQSRLALRSVEIGDMAGAAEHYKRAYELMPDSFGRVESHCFGCEGVFDGDFAQNIAEKTLAAVAKSRPDKAQVHYLLGYLHKEEGHYEDALSEFQEAVKLDPDYLNAWGMIASIDGIAQYITVRVPAALMESVEFNSLRLDPLGRHSGFDATRIMDLAAAWKAQETVLKLRSVNPPALYPLAASMEEKTKLEKEIAAKQNANPGTRAIQSHRPEDTGEGSYPGYTLIARNPFFQLIAQIYPCREVLKPDGP